MINKGSQNFRKVFYMNFALGMCLVSKSMTNTANESLTKWEWITCSNTYKQWLDKIIITIEFKNIFVEHWSDKLSRHRLYKKIEISNCKHQFEKTGRGLYPEWNTFLHNLIIEKTLQATCFCSEIAVCFESGALCKNTYLLARYTSIMINFWYCPFFTARTTIICVHQCCNVQ